MKKRELPQPCNRRRSLAIFGVLMEKTWVLSAGQAQSWLDLPMGTYVPTWVEVLGMVTLGFLLYLGASHLEPKEI